MFNKIDATVLFVKNLDNCTAFYRDVLGLEVTFSDDVSIGFRVEGQDFLLLKFSSAVEMIGEEALSSNDGGACKVLLCAGVENVDAVHAALEAKGVAFIRPPINQPWGRRTAYFADPEGNLWEIFQNL